MFKKRKSGVLELKAYEIFFTPLFFDEWWIHYSRLFILYTDVHLHLAYGNRIFINLVFTSSMVHGRSSGWCVGRFTTQLIFCNEDRLVMPEVGNGN